VIGPLVESGKLPTLERLERRVVWGLRNLQAPG
jgi:hypothetical protein